MGKTSKDKRDIYYRMAKEQKWRARSAFKLLQIDETFNIFEGVTKVVDLCAAPGSWSQVCAKKLILDQPDKDKRNKVKIVAVDLQPMSPLDGVMQLQGDITEMDTANNIIKQFDGQKANLVICDGAPDVTGEHSFDEHLQSQLVLAAFNIASYVLEEDGSFVSKIFRAKNVTLLYAQMKLFFVDVFCAKPKSSRQSSCECFIVCKKYRPPTGYKPTLTNPLNSRDYEEYINNLQPPNRVLVPFMACGDLSGFDADRSYPLDLELISDVSRVFSGKKYEFNEVVQPPTDPGYKDAVSMKKQGLLTKPEVEVTGRPISIILKNKTPNLEAKKETLEVESIEDKDDYDLFDGIERLILG